MLLFFLLSLGFFKVLPVVLLVDLFSVLLFHSLHLCLDFLDSLVYLWLNFGLGFFIFLGILFLQLLQTVLVPFFVFFLDFLHFLWYFLFDVLFHFLYFRLIIFPESLDLLQTVIMRLFVPGDEILNLSPNLNL